MSSSQELPSGWLLESEETTYDSMMGREYATVVYRQRDTDATVRIFEILQPKANTWGYHVHSSGRNGDIGTADDLDSAKDMALTYMGDNQAT